MDPKQIINERLQTTSQTELARQLGVSAAYVSDVARGARGAGPKLLKALGLVEHKVYIPAQAPQQ